MCEVRRLTLKVASSVSEPCRREMEDTRAAELCALPRLVTDWWQRTVDD